MSSSEPCFASCVTCGLHTAGSWVPHGSGEQPYRLGGKAWSELGLRSLRYDECDRQSPERQRYEWLPSACSLLPLSREKMCSLLRGKSVLVVGDSLAAQLFLSLNGLLASTFGRNL